MCPVPRTTNGDLVEDPPKAKDICSSDQNSDSNKLEISDNNEGANPADSSVAAVINKVIIVKIREIPQYILDQYDFNKETEAYILSQVDCAYSEKMNRHLASNCRNISDEVFPGVHLGDRGAAKNTFYLKKAGVTHVLNTAEGTRSGLVDTNQNFYRPFGIKYKGLKLLDVAQTNIAMYFSEVAEFIDEALQSGGKVLVNCLMGMSRSSTCVLAYLMLRQNMTAVEALTAVRRYREVRPNDGFLRQLADLDNKLRRERGQLSKSAA